MERMSLESRAADGHRALLALREQSISDVIKDRLLYMSDLCELFIDSSMVVDVFQTFGNNNYLSLPVFSIDAQTGSKVYKGVVDVVDLMLYLLSQPALRDVDPEESEDSLAGRMLAKGNSILQQPASVLLATCAHDLEKHHVYESTDSLNVLLDSFSSGSHRTLVRFEVMGHDFVRMVTQTDVLRYLQTQVAGLLESAVAGDVMSSDLKTVLLSQTALEGFKLMQSKSIRALPVVDTGGLLVGTLSASQLRKLTYRTLALLHLPVEKFLKRVPYSEPPSCDPSTSLNNVAMSLLSSRSHRVW
eukprot:CAMPEP_0184647062 /NCGR_PEP_ID=MMETSP0308-20130426/3948_1 /TAXON_ID=38269 /ORGANISM="Gloeochaete witrockiana, Strain SAG 46.84" /LENGTH=301 /DNA_ID=CAMNT_0027077735 /DNA_START=329 /DNA_END=1231 /DNA_ORIENTATION=-